MWGRYGFTSPEDMYAAGNEERAARVLSEMTLNATSHCVDALDYLILLKNQTVFNFCAIPVAMAIAALELCFMNPAVFQRNIKIRRAEAVRLIVKSTNPRNVAYIFRDHSRKIHGKVLPSDPNYLGICAMWGKIETWVERRYPSFVTFSEAAGKAEYSPSDPRSRIVDRYRDLQVLEQRRARGEDVTKPRPAERGDMRIPWQLYAFVLGMMLFLFVAAGVSMWGMLWWFEGEKWTWEDFSVLVDGKLKKAAGRFAVVQEQAKQKVLSQRGIRG